MRKLLASALVLCSLTVSAHDHYNGPIPEAALPDNTQGPLGHNVAVPTVAPPLTTSKTCMASFAYPGSILGVATVDQDCVRRYTGAARAACMLPFGTFDFDCLERKRQKEERYALQLLESVLTPVVANKEPNIFPKALVLFMFGILVAVLIFGGILARRTKTESVEAVRKRTTD